MAEHGARKACPLCALLRWKACGRWVGQTWLTLGEYLSLQWHGQESLKKDKAESEFGICLASTGASRLYWRGMTGSVKKWSKRSHTAR